MATVEAAQQFEQDRREGSPETLGDVLYADAKSLVSEENWVGLVQSVAAGDQLALHALYERAHRVVFILILRITGNRETAEELTLDVFYAVWRRAARYDAENDTVLGWIMNQARSRAIDRLRFELRRKRVYPPALAAAETGDSHDVELKQQSRALRNVLSVLVAFFSELTYAEAAARLNQSLATVKTRIRSELHKLRRALAAEVKKP